MIPRIYEKVEAPIISIERHLIPGDVAKTDAFLNMVARFRNTDRQLGIEGRKLPKEDLNLLVDMIDKYFRHESEKVSIDLGNFSDDIIQIVEIDFTMIDLYPGNTEIHYRLYTKRGIGRRIDT
jgi:hypothetical protein